MLEHFYTVNDAAKRLGLANDENPESAAGVRWLRRGVNREHNPFPHHRLGKRLMFSESDLAEIAAMHRNASTQGARRRTRRTSRPMPAAA
ncbi:helix-turn-helix domain-containing protein [Streptomyces sp. NPDC048241]|uniref:helix-turn-helix domain-containing protein n=1 Tax=Streptomyces sp. NPDC048241 TaxID=3365521 RepID=UPI00371212F6